MAACILAWSSNIKIHPWVGDNYKSGILICGTPMKILLVGESHNTDTTDKRSQGVSFTQDSINNCIAPEGSDDRHWKPASYWARVAKVVAGPDNYNPPSFWQSVAFYNYLQTFQHVNNHPGSDEYEMWRSALEEVLQKLEPDGIIVLCKRLWPYVEDSIKSRGFWINHPSRICYSYWHSRILSKLAELQKMQSD